jgi:hypothetical protein
MRRLTLSIWAAALVAAVPASGQQAELVDIIDKMTAEMDLNARGVSCDVAKVEIVDAQTKRATCNDGRRYRLIGARRPMVERDQ